MDRTQELFALAAELRPSALNDQKQSLTNAQADHFGEYSENAPTKAAPVNQSEFLRQASTISREIRVAAAKLSRLAQLMKRRGIREDAASMVERDIETLSNDINVSLSAVGSSLTHLESSITTKKSKIERLGITPGQPIPSHLRTNPLSSAPAGSSKHSANAKRSGVSEPSPTNTNSNTPEVFCDVMDSLQGLSHCNVVVTGLKTELKTVTDSLKGFGAIHMQSIQRTTDRRALFGQRPDRADLGKPLQLRPSNRGAPTRLHSASTSRSEGHSRSAEDKLSLLENDAFVENRASADDEVAISFGSAAFPDDPTAAFSQLSKQDLMPLQGDQLALARQRDLQNIEGSVRELSSLFAKLSELVQSQGQELERIDANLEESDVRVQSGMNQLNIALANLKKRRFATISVVTILVAFLIYFVVFMV